MSPTTPTASRCSPRISFKVSPPHCDISEDRDSGLSGRSQCPAHSGHPKVHSLDRQLCKCLLGKHRNGGANCPLKAGDTKPRSLFILLHFRANDKLFNKRAPQPITQASHSRRLPGNGGAPRGGLSRTMTPTHGNRGFYRRKVLCRLTSFLTTLLGALISKALK